MGKYRIKVAATAQKDFAKIFKSGDKASITKLEKIVKELEDHPTIGSGNPEDLKHNLSGYWGRRINKKDLLIYLVIEEPNHLVVMGHY